MKLSWRDRPTVCVQSQNNPQKCTAVTCSHHICSHEPCDCIPDHNSSHMKTHAGVCLRLLAFLFLYWQRIQIQLNGSQTGKRDIWLWQQNIQNSGLLISEKQKPYPPGMVSESVALMHSQGRGRIKRIRTTEMSCWVTETREAEMWFWSAALQIM